MTPDKPSYLNSTTSQILLGACLAYALGCLWLTVKGQDGLAGLRWLVELSINLYAIRKGAEIVKNGNGTPPPTTPPTVTPPPAS